MQGKHVLHPMGWDAFGLPAEQHAIKTGTHPARYDGPEHRHVPRQLKMLGFSYDWSRELSTTDPDYYRWTQWIFLQLFDTWYDPEFEWTGPDGEAAHRQRAADRRIADSGRRPVRQPSGRRVTARPRPRAIRIKHRLAYQQRSPGQLVPGAGHGAGQRRSHRRQERTRRPSGRTHSAAAVDAAHHGVRRPADRANWTTRLARVDQAAAAELDRAQRRGGSRFLSTGRASSVEWTRRQGTSDARHRRSTSTTGSRHAREAGFPQTPGADVLRIYTTRPDTLFGATYMVLAPEHPLVDRITTPEQQRGRRCVSPARRRSRAISTAPTSPRTRPASSPAAMPSTRSTANGSRSGSPTMCSSATAPGPSWRCRRMMSATGVRETVRNCRSITVVKLADVAASLAEGRAGHWRAVVATARHRAVSPAKASAINSGDVQRPADGRIQDPRSPPISTAAGFGREAVNYRLRDWLFSPAALLGRAVPDLARTRCRRASRPG